MSGSIVQELQKNSLNNDTKITDLLRKALVVAKKLKVHELEKWVQLELEGYQDTKAEDMPKYRILKGTPQVWNPYHGWQPIMFENSKQAESLSTRGCSQPISEIEFMIANHKSGGHFEIQYPGEVAKQLMRAMGMNLQPVLHVSASSISSILDSVRNIVLNWSLKLEEDGILGTDISFNSSEIEMAASQHYTINNFNGSMVNSQIQQGTTNSTQTLDSGINKDVLEKILKSIVDQADKISVLTEKQKADFDAELATINAQMKSSNPKSVIIKESLLAIKDFLIIAGADLTAVMIHGYLSS